MKNEKRKAKKKGERKGKEERAEMACSINNTRRGSGIEGRRERTEEVSSPDLLQKISPATCCFWQFNFVVLWKFGVWGGEGGREEEVGCFVEKEEVPLVLFSSLAEELPVSAQSSTSPRTGICNYAPT